MSNAVAGKKIGVGIIGASPDRGWASDAHIPALKTQGRFEFAALSTSRRESAELAGKQFGVDLVFDHHEPLVQHPAVDLVAVTVKVPYHLELASAAINAGKAVYCEWPLGNGVEEAEQLAEMAREKGVYAAVGLQARSAPVINYVKDLVAEGYVGEVLSSTIVADGMNWGADVLQCYTYLLDSRNGATMLTIPFAHTVDAFCWCLGEFESLQATLATRRPQVKLVETGEMLNSDAPDQIVLSGSLESGAVASVHFRGGLSRGTHFLWEINGTEGDLVITADGGHTQMLPLSLKGGRGDNRELSDMAVPSRYNPIGDVLPDGPAASVARAYHQLAAELTGDAFENALPSFEDAVVRHRMIAAIERSAETGERQSYQTRY